MRWRAAILWLLRLGLCALYIFAAAPKLADPWAFARSIHNFKILPDGIVPELALWLPPFEGLAALAVLTGLFYRGGLLAISGMSAAFAAGVASAMARGLDIDCGCFGEAAHSRANLPHLLLNLASLAAGIVLLAASARSARRHPTPARSPRR